MTDDSEHWDAIVIGSGLGGLTCAAYLATAGVRVLVLEQHDVAGGNSHVFRRRRAYEFDVGVHYLGDCGPDGVLPAILGGVGVRDRVTFLPMDQHGFDQIMLPGLRVDMPAGWAPYRARLVAALPGEETGIDRFLGVCRALGEEMRDGLLGAELPMSELASRTPVTLQWSRRTLTELFEHCGLSPVARTVLAAQSPNYGIGPDQATVGMHATVTDHYVRGAYYPQGGGQMLAAAFVEVIESHGGQLRTKARVERIHVEAGRVTGVTVAGAATPIRSDLVVSNADYRRTVLDLVEPGHLPRPVVKKAREAQMGLPFLTLYVALNRELAERPNANVWWYDTDDIDGYYRSLERDRLDDVRFLFMSFASRKDPGSAAVCPPGHSNFQIMTLCPADYAQWGATTGPADGGRYRRNSDYLAEKERLTGQMVTAAETVLGPFRDSIAHLEVATPLTHERYTRSTGGTPFGLARWGRAGTGRPDTRTAVDGLHVVGASTRYGSGITGVAVGGVACAAQILGRRLLPEAHGGHVFADRDLLPHRPDGWDPLVVSRGVTRRGARGLARTGLR